jgi:Na+-transporting NADH:ubiquinone oxidoreductase subunit NqrC
MSKRDEKGYAIIMVLVLSAVLMVSLSTALITLTALRKQNNQAKQELKLQEKAINQ